MGVLEPFPLRRAEAALSLEVVALREMAAVYFTITKDDVASPPRPLIIDFWPKLPPKPKTVSGLSEARLSLASAANEIALQARRGVPRTSSAKKGGDSECMLRVLRGRRVQGPVPSGPARGDPARTQLGWGAFRTARGL